ncbi:Kelch repeat-containing protein [Anaerotignum sp. MB30-C6]|uniref:Kelch repeat-containing protein n=1 Tax=Anaerotignum sp. MB30-C6 TaxID=3070814 RepID=UPI0027DD3087|nr:kelch repeat-containing protein [Anaerotignum sp. MB30-C6]WMI82621.1 kelch repeat-containing protein [Anaerotignum sp. MB30-C6]
MMKKIIVKILGILVVWTLFLPSTSACAYEEKTSWKELASMPTSKFSFQSEVIDGKIYTTGGCWNSDYTKNLALTEAYDPSTNTWANLASMPARWEFETEVLDGKLYVIGGTKMDTWELISSTDVYDPSTNTWTTLTSMPIALAEVDGFQTEVVNGKIYVFGVIPDGTCTSVTEVYNPTTDTWAILAPMLTPREGCQTEVIDGKIYVIGGYRGLLKIGGASNVDSLSSAEVYDPSTDKWTTLASMSETRCYLQTEVIDGKIYALGGWNVKVGDITGKVLSSTEVYDPSTNRWTTLADMSTPRQIFQTEVIDDKIYAVGGYGPFYTDNQLLSPLDYDNRLSSTEVYDPSTNKWTTLENMSKKRSCLHTEVIDKVIYAIGGANSTYLESYAVPTSATK